MLPPRAAASSSFLMTMCFFYPFISPGIMSAGVFEGTGKGTFALAVEFFRNLVFVAAFAYLFAIVLDLGETGAWWGIVVGNILGSTFGYGWARVYIARLTSRQENP